MGALVWFVIGLKTGWSFEAADRSWTGMAKMAEVADTIAMPLKTLLLKSQSESVAVCRKEE